MRDLWCERQLFGNTSIAEPVAASTGFVMLAVFVVWPKVVCASYKVPAEFKLVRVSLVLLAIGTIVFHSLSYEIATENVHVNVNMFDWLPLVLTAASLVLLYTQQLFHSRGYVYYTAILIWALFLVMAMDSTAYEFWESSGKVSWGLLLNILLLLPLFVLLAYYTYVVSWIMTWRLWALLGTSLLLWVLNVALCKQASWLAPLHALYHVVMAFALVHAACLGLVFSDAGWEFRFSEGFFWMLCVHKIEDECDKGGSEKGAGGWLLGGANDFSMTLRTDK